MGVESTDMVLSPASSHEVPSATVRMWQFVAPEYPRPVENRPMTDGEREIWGQDGPAEEVVFASGSIRKAVNFLQTLNGFRYVLAELRDGRVQVLKENPTPLEFYAHLAQHTTNGNGELKDKVLLGYYHGVPVYVDHQNGEEDADNHPTRQARKKIEWYARQHADGKDRIVIACDTVDGPLSDGLSYASPEEHPFFPREDTVFPGTMPEHRFSIAQLQELFSAIYSGLQKAVENNKRESGHYLLGKPASLEGYPRGDAARERVALYFYSLILFYSPQPVELLHTNGIAMVRTFDKRVEEIDFDQEIITETVDLRVSLPANTVVQAHPQRGNGGVTEAGYEYPTPGIELFPALFREDDIAWVAWLSQSGPDLDDPRLKYELCSLVTGMPAHIFLYLIAQNYFAASRSSET